MTSTTHRPAARVVVAVTALALAVAGCRGDDAPELVLASPSPVPTGATDAPQGDDTNNDDPGTDGDSPSPTSGDPTSGDPTDGPTDAASDTGSGGDSATTPDDGRPQVGEQPPDLPHLTSLGPDRLVVEHDNGIWARLDGGSWFLVGHAWDVSVWGEGRWTVDFSTDDRVMRSIDDPSVTCPTPDGFFGDQFDTAIIHEQGLTTVFVADDVGAFESVVCEDPGRPTPITSWRPPGDGDGEGQFGPYVDVQDGVTLSIFGDAEGNATVYDATGEDVLIDYAISGPLVDADAGVMVYVAIDGGMHFAGGTLVVTDLDGVEERRIDLGGESWLVGLTDGVALVHRVELPDFEVVQDVLVDVSSGVVLDRVDSLTTVSHIGD